MIKTNSIEIPSDTDSTKSKTNDSTITSNCESTTNEIFITKVNDTKVIENCVLSWNNIFYEVNEQRNYKNFLTKLKSQNINLNNNKRVVLNNISGSLRCGQLLALIGPSGVGKSTLLQILSGRRVFNVKGNVYLHGCRSFNKNNKLSFIPQKDNHIENLTIKETLLYASKLKNYDKVNKIIKKNQDILLGNISSTNSSTDTIYSNNSSTTSSLNVPNLDQIENNILNEKPILLNFTNTDQYHEYFVNQIISELMLDNCSDTLVNKCSGGQLKRLSIALELLTQPKVIIMDEPTTGLDFSSAFNCIQILKNLTINNLEPPAIIISIHQPSSSVMELFDKLYVLAKGGNCIYNGDTHNLVDYLKKFNFPCPHYFNPCDLLIQISSGEYGDKSLNKMNSYQSLITKQELEDNIYNLKYKYDLSNLIKDININKPKRLNQIKLLIQRDIKNSSRKPLLNILRFIYFTFFAFFIYSTYNYEIGEFNGCYSDLIDTTNNLNPINNAQKLAKLSDNSSILFFITMFLVISSIMPAALTFPNEITIFVRERSNCWYSAFTYYFAKFIADSPSYVLFPILFTSLFYPLTNQIESLVRFFWFNFIVIINSLITRSIGMIIGSIFLNDTLSAVFVSTCAIFPFMLSAGFLIRYSVSTWLLKPFWYFSFVRYTFGCFLIIIYGWGRCKNTNSINFLMDNQDTNDLSIDNFTNYGLKNVLSNYLRKDEMQCLIKNNENNFTIFSDLINECELNINSIKSSLVNNSTLISLAKYDYSFILNYFELTNDDFSNYFLSLILILLSLTILNYWILLFKVKRCSQY